MLRVIRQITLQLVEHGRTLLLPGEEVVLVLAGEELSVGSFLEEVDGSSISASLCSVVNFELANQKTDHGFMHSDSVRSVYACVSVCSGKNAWCRYFVTFTKVTRNSTSLQVERKKKLLK